MDGGKGTARCTAALCGISVSYFVKVPKHQSPQEQASGYYWCEAVFLQNEDVEMAFRAASDSYPIYEFVPDAFHVTTQYKPEQKHESLYGTTVTVHIIGYISGSVWDTEEDFVSENEGLFVEVRP